MPYKGKGGKWQIGGNQQIPIGTGAGEVLQRQLPETAAARPAVHKAAGPGVYRKATGLDGHSKAAGPARHHKAVGLDGHSKAARLAEKAASRGWNIHIGKAVKPRNRNPLRNGSA